MLRELEGKMKRLLASLSILACLGFTSSSVAQLPEVWIRGTVYNASTGDPVPMAVIAVTDSDDASDAAQTNDEGGFVLSVSSQRRPIELAVVHGCYHKVQLELVGQAVDNTRRVDIGLPPDNEQYGQNSAPLGGCPTR